VSSATASAAATRPTGPSLMSALPEFDTLGIGDKTSTVAARAIRAAILDGRLAPGSPLREGDLAARLGMSRTPVREALLLLQSDGLVEIMPNRGATVRTYTTEDIEDVYTLRAMLEGYAARSATERITARQLRELHDSCNRYERLRGSADKLPELVEENLRFHDIIIDAAGRDRLRAMVRQVTAVPLIYRSYMAYSGENRRTAEQAHRTITEALEQRDADQAAARMEHHVLWARAQAIEHLPALPSGG
jgi:DNA-binding GntR family transcriptional regulator